MEKLFLVVILVAGLGSASLGSPLQPLPSMVNPTRNGVANSLEDFSAQLFGRWSKRSRSSTKKK
jgi:hypothetical protein